MKNRRGKAERQSEVGAGWLEATNAPAPATFCNTPKVPGHLPERPLEAAGFPVDFTFLCLSSLTLPSNPFASGENAFLMEMEVVDG